ASKIPPPVIEARNNAALRQYFLSHSALTFEWMRSLGLAFQGPNPEPPNRVARMHNVVPGAKAYIAVLQAQLEKYGGIVRRGANVVDLVWQEDRVIGVMVETAAGRETIRAELGVVLAAGDYANARDLIAEFKGESFAAVEGINPNAGGDGHRLSRLAGAQLL